MSSCTTSSSYGSTSSLGDSCYSSSSCISTPIRHSDRVVPRSAVEPTEVKSKAPIEVKSKVKKMAAYGQFLNTFDFGSRLPQLQVVQPKGTFVFPVTTIDPVGVQYFNDGTKSGVLVPQGDYKVSYKVNTEGNSQIAITVNDKIPRASNGYLYTVNSQTNKPINFSCLIKAPKKINLVSLTNIGNELISLGYIRGTKNGTIGTVTDFIIEGVIQHHAPLSPPT